MCPPAPSAPSAHSPHFSFDLIFNGLVLVSLPFHAPPYCGKPRAERPRQALALAKSEEAAAVALSRAAVEGQRGAEAALRVLGRFVGPLHRLCLELREQKRFLARSYRRDKPLQVQYAYVVYL